MIYNLPTLNMSGNHISAPLTSRDKRSRLICHQSMEQQISVLQNGAKLVRLDYFKKKGMFCTVSRQKDKIQFYTEKNSVLLGLWIDTVLNCFQHSHTDIYQFLKNDDFDLQIHNGVPSQFAGFNTNITMKSFLLKTLKQLNRVREESIYGLEKIFFQMLIDYPFLVFCGVSYIRAKGLAHLKENINKYQLDLLGNEEDLFKDYSAQLRNTPLQIIADSLNISISLKHSQTIQLFGYSKCCLSIQRIGSSYVSFRNLPSCKKQQGSTIFNSTLTSSSQELEYTSAHKICTKCMNIKTGKFCDCRKKKNTIQSAKKKCDKCQTSYVFVCKCYLDE